MTDSNAGREAAKEGWTVQGDFGAYERELRDPLDDCVEHLEQSIAGSPLDLIRLRTNCDVESCSHRLWHITASLSRCEILKVLHLVLFVRHFRSASCS